MRPHSPKTVKMSRIFRCDAHARKTISRSIFKGGTVRHVYHRQGNDRTNVKVVQIMVDNLRGTPQHILMPLLSLESYSSHLTTGATERHERVQQENSVDWLNSCIDQYPDNPYYPASNILCS